MREQFENDLVAVLAPYIDKNQLQDVRMRITMMMDKYDVSLRETALTVWDGDRNEMMLRRFLASKLAKGCSARTIKYYKESVTRALQQINKNYDEVTADDMRLYLAIRVQRDGVSKTTANNERRNMSSFYDWLQKEEILLKNPMRKVEVIKEEKKKKKAFALLDLEKIRFACKTNRERAIIEMLSSTWCRATELVNIRLDEIHDGKVIVHGKGAKDREVYINARAQMAVEQYMRERKDNNPYLLPHAKYAGSAIKFSKGISRSRQAEWYTDPSLVDMDGHMDYSSLGELVRKIGKRAGVAKCHPHRFRRTGATMALRQGMPLTTVSKLLGHESIETTQIYLDISDEELEQAHRKYVV